MKQPLALLSSLLILAATPLLATPVSAVPEPTTFGLVGATAGAGVLMLVKKLGQTRNK